MVDFMSVASEEFGGTRVPPARSSFLLPFVFFVLALGFVSALGLEAAIRSFSSDPYDLSSLPVSSELLAFAELPASILFDFS